MHNCSKTALNNVPCTDHGVTSSPRLPDPLKISTKNCCVAACAVGSHRQSQQHTKLKTTSAQRICSNALSPVLPGLYHMFVLWV